jgi:L-alanine-DL-glutamate epimerase-like enolase superfamily enzyme
MHDFRYGTRPANQGLEVDVSSHPLALIDGAYQVPTAPGLGVEVDEGMVEKLRSTA